ncbi:hypothetical protein CANINC_004421 [Pichia inconspicua]|uniref:Peptidase A1 domain-containing protein n=1 Tax=Pichia inconspicua TaxID=52247 RepID=A0A4T0WWD5_9ASCO|nr:hypothetical protein CANINC_004421 [[Candida] inconspicua]
MMLPTSIAIWLAVISNIGEAAYVNLPFQKRWYDHQNRPLSENKSYLTIKNRNIHVKRESPDAYFQVETKFNQLFYEVELEIGSQKDPVTLLLDTGSSDIIINTANNPECQAADVDNDQNVQNLQKRNAPVDVICIQASATKIISDSIASSNSDISANRNTSDYPRLNKTIKYASDNDDYLMAIAPKVDPLYDCYSFGVFNYSESNSFEITNVPLDIEYYDGSGAVGIYGKDTIYLNDVEIPYTTIGLNTKSYLAKGVLGIGFNFNENAFQNGYPKYESFPEHLKTLGLTNRAVYSIYGVYGKRNSILFGAYDKSAYIEEKGLTLIPIVAYNPGTKVGEGPFYVSVTLSSISFTSSKLSNEIIASGNAIALLDTGASYSTVPYYVLNEILTKFDFKWSSQLETFVISESDIPKDQTFLTFNFQSAKVEIPLIDFTYPIIDGQTLSNTGLRSISIEGGDDDRFILGDDFLSSVYLIVDQEAQSAALGQANPNKDDTNIQIVENTIIDAIKSPEYDEVYNNSDHGRLMLTTVDNPNHIQTIESFGQNIQLYQPGLGNDLKW